MSSQTEKVINDPNMEIQLNRYDQNYGVYYSLLCLYRHKERRDEMSVKPVLKIPVVISSQKPKKAIQYSGKKQTKI